MPSATETYSIRAGVNSAGDDATRGRLVTAAAPSSEAEPETGAAAPAKAAAAAAAARVPCSRACISLQLIFGGN